MISLRDVDVLDKFAGKLFIPFLAIAYFLQPPFDLGLLKVSSVSIGLLNFSLCLAAAGFFSIILHQIFVLLDVYLFDGKLFPFIGMLFIGFGLLVLCKIGGKDPFNEINYFWNLASLTYGLVIFQIIEKTNT